MGNIDVRVRALQEADLGEADRIMRLAFGTFLGLPDPGAFMGDADYVRSRWAADPASALAAEVDGRLVGTNFVTRWGSVGFFGPLTVDPSIWDKGVGRALMNETMTILSGWEVSHAGLFTFPQSAKHLGLYQSFGFLPHFLTSVLARPPATADDAEAAAGDWSTADQSPDLDQVVEWCGRVTDETYPGLDVGREIRATAAQKLGDTVLIFGDGEIEGFAVCHTGAGSEAGTGTCFIKFGAVLPGHGAPVRFARLVAACEAFAAGQGAQTMVAGVSTGRRGAYHVLLERGYRAELVGVTMHLPDQSAYHNASAWVIDDWR